MSLINPRLVLYSFHHQLKVICPRCFPFFGLWLPASFPFYQLELIPSDTARLTLNQFDMLSLTITFMFAHNHSVHSVNQFGDALSLKDLDGNLLLCDYSDLDESVASMCLLRCRRSCRFYVFIKIKTEFSVLYICVY